MYRVIKALNHNAVLALESGTNAEYLIMGKGIGFGKKVSERIEPGEDSVIYSLQSVSKRGKSKRTVPGDRCKIFGNGQCDFK